MSKLKKQWWCIKHECNHNRIHVYHHGRVIEHVGCAHSSILDKIDINPNLGLSIDKIQMCPVLCTDVEACII